MFFWLTLLTIITILAALWFLGLRQYSRDWLDSQLIAWRRRQAVRLRIPQYAHNILMVQGEKRRKDIDFVYEYTTPSIHKELGPKRNQEIDVFDYQGLFPLLNRSEKTDENGLPLFALTYEGGLAYSYFTEKPRYDNSNNPYASTALFSGEKNNDPYENSRASLLIVEAEYEAEHYKGQCIAIYVPLDDHAYDNDEGLELVFVCAWQNLHKNRYERAIKASMEPYQWRRNQWNINILNKPPSLRINYVNNVKAYAWKGDILLYFPGKWERLLPTINRDVLQKRAQETYESSLAHQDSLRRRFLRQRERNKDGAEDSS